LFEFMNEAEGLELAWEHGDEPFHWRAGYPILILHNCRKRVSFLILILHVQC
jgi:hypothetical protein